VAKLINILAASVGGGILLGAGIRLGEAIVGREPVPTTDTAAGSRLEARLGALEDRLVNLEVIKPAPVAGARGESQTVAAIRSELSREDERVAALSQIGAQLRVELQGWLEQSVGSRMADVEAKLRAESDEARRQMLDAFAESVQTRVTHRISRLEEEVAGQSAAMAELRDCSLRTEQSLQKLLGGLDRLLVPRPTSPLADVSSDQEAIAQDCAPIAGNLEARPEPYPEPAPAPESVPEQGTEGSASAVPAGELHPKHRRWSLFG